MPEQTVNNFVDTWADKARPTLNYAGSRTLTVGSPAGSEAYAYLYVNRPMPLGATVLSATLTLRRAALHPAASGRKLYLRPITSPLSINRVTWNAAPTVGTDVASIYLDDAGGPAGQSVAFDVRELLQLVADGAVWRGFRLSTTELARRAWHSAEATAALRPKLTVVWAMLPATPTGLSPSGPKAVSTTHPLLRWTATGGTADSLLVAHRVQISQSSTFSSVEYDSGWVDSTQAQHVTAGTAWAGLPLQVSYSATPAPSVFRYWRVAVRDSLGVESLYSQGAAMNALERGTVTIVNPPPSGVVSDPSPPVLWTFAGNQDQRFWRVVVAESQRTLYDSGSVLGTQTSHTIPDGILAGRGPYWLVVQVYDSASRQTIPGANQSAERGVSFRIEPDSTVAAVTDLTASQDDAWPSVYLRWQRAQVPDRFLIYRDGLQIATVAPEAAQVAAGQGYTFEDETARTWAPHTWEVQAVVNNASSTPAVVSLTPKHHGIWLTDKARDLRVWLAGRESASFSLPEDATVFAPVGGTEVVRRIQGQRGYEGSVAGVLIDGAGHTALRSQADLQTMRSTPELPVVLSMADLSMTVLIGNIQIAPTQHTPPARTVAVDFWQVTE